MQSHSPLLSRQQIAHRCYSGALEKQRVGDVAAAVDLYESALSSAPRHYAILTNLGVCLGLLGRHEEAFKRLRKANKVKPNDPTILGALGAASYHVGDLAVAMSALRRAVGADPSNHEAALFLALTLDRSGNKEDAISLLERVVVAAPTYTMACAELARLFGNAQRREDEAEMALQAWRLDPSKTEPNIRAFFALRSIADWRPLGNLDKGFLERLRADRTQDYLGNPFNLLARTNDRAIHRKVAERRAAWLTRAHRVREPFRRWRTRKGGEPLRVGYLSADFHDHATMRLMAGVYRAHDPRRVKIHSYSYGPDEDDAYRRLVVERSACFRDLRSASAREAADRIHGDELDLLVDLKGYTRGARLEIAAYRPAPVQATWLGYPGTLGADWIDYAIVDETVAPPEHAADFSETLAYHPVCYQPNDPVAPPDPKTERCAWGLPEGATVFCSFNQTYKIDPERFATWMLCLKAVDGSVIWLSDSNGAVIARLRSEAAARGVAPERLIFASKVSHNRHLERLRHADIALDTRLYNGHTTTTDALLMEVPVIAVAGGHFAARVSASLLRAAGLEELVAPDEAAFVAMAAAIGDDAGRRRELRERVRRARTTSPLFEPVAFTRSLEDLFGAMVDRGPAHPGCRAPLMLDARK